MDEIILQLMRTTIDLARKARENGNHPFGAVLVDDQNTILMTAENIVITENDCTCHAETNLVSQASKEYSPRDFLEKCTLYASTGTTSNVLGAIFWSNIGRVIFGLSQNSLYELIEKITPRP